MLTAIRILVMVLLWSSVGGVEIAKAYEAVDGFQGTMVKGRITFHGNVPQPEQYDVRRDFKFCGETMVVVPMEMNPDSHGVSNVVVSIEGIEKGKTIQGQQSAPLMNKQCRFEPLTQAATVNAKLEISSEDPVLHNTHLRMNEKTFLNIALPPKGRVIQKVLKKPGRLEVRCDAHKFMHATIHVFPHPYFALTNKDGEFEISGVPAGDYQLTLWHKVVGTIKKPIAVPSSGEMALSIDLSDSK